MQNFQKVRGLYPTIEDMHGRKCSNKHVIFDGECTVNRFIAIHSVNNISVSQYAVVPCTLKIVQWARESLRWRY